MPDVALSAAAAALFYSLFLFPGYQKFFRDSDAGWHIRAGERMLASRSLPVADPYSFTMAGKRWFAWEWGADVCIGTIHRGWGLTGVALFYGCAIAAGVWLWFQLNWLAGGTFLLGCLFAAPMLSTMNLHWLARPHVLSWLFLAGAVMFAEKLRADPRLTPARILGVAAVSCLWANLHASFFLGFGIGLIYLCGAAGGALLWVGEKPRSVPVFGVLAVTSAAATLLNPYGWNLHRHVWEYLADSQLLDRIGEFQSFNFHAEGTFQILAALGIAALGGALAIGQRNLAVFLLSACLIVAALRSARGLPLVALLLLPLANGTISKALAEWQGLRPGVRRGLDGFLAYSRRLRAFDKQAAGLAWVPVVVGLCFAGLRMPAIAAATGFPADQFPVAASSVIEQLPPEARILAPDKFGGYLIYRFQGRRKVFFDGRSDLYGAEFLKQYGRLMQLRPGWRQILEPYGFTHALLPADYSLIPALQRDGWKTLYRDEVCTLLARNEWTATKH